MKVKFLKEDSTSYLFPKWFVMIYPEDYQELKILDDDVRFIKNRDVSDRTFFEAGAIGALKTKRDKSLKEQIDQSRKGYRTAWNPTKIILSKYVWGYLWPIPALYNSKGDLWACELGHDGQVVWAEAKTRKEIIAIVKNDISKILGKSDE